MFLTNLPNPASQSINPEHPKTHNPTKVAALGPTQAAAPGTGPVAVSASFFPSEGKIHTLAIAPIAIARSLARSEVQGSGLGHVQFAVGHSLQVSSFIEILATLLEGSSLEAGASV